MRTSTSLSKFTDRDDQTINQTFAQRFFVNRKTTPNTMSSSKAKKNTKVAQLINQL